MPIRNSNLSLKELLIKNIPVESLQCKDNCDTWLKELSDWIKDDLGILALYGPEGLSENLPDELPVRIPICAADNAVLTITNKAIKAKEPIGIALPPGAAMMPMLMICKSLLGDLLEVQEYLADPNREKSIKERGGILLVSPNSEMRARYFSMKVGRQPVVEAYPACRLRPDGSIEGFISKHSNYEPGQFNVSFFVAHRKQLPEIEKVLFKPAVVLLDFVHDKWSNRRIEILEWCKSLLNKIGQKTILIILLPGGDSISKKALKQSNIPIFELDANCIKELGESFLSIPPPKNEAEKEAYQSWSFSGYTLKNPLERKHTLYYLPDEAAAPILEPASRIYNILNHTGNISNSRDLRLATWLINLFLQMPIPVQWYEEHAFLMGNRQTLKRLIATIGTNIQGSLGLQIAPTLQTLRGHLKSLYVKLQESNPKSLGFLEHFREYINPALDEGKKVVIVCRNDVIARALFPWLESENVKLNDKSRLQILTYKFLDSRSDVDKMLCTGPWPLRYKWQLGGKMADEFDLLLYQGEENVFRRQILSFYGSFSQTYYKNQRFSFLRSLGANLSNCEKKEELGTTNLNLIIENSTQNLDQQKVDNNLPQFTDFDEDTIELFDENIPSLFEVATSQWQQNLDKVLSEPLVRNEPIVLPMLANPIDDEESPTDIESITNDEESNERCIVLKLQKAQDTRSEDFYLYLDENGTTDCYDPSQPKEGLLSIENENLCSGFILIRTEEEDRRGLFERMVEIADSQPKVKYLRTWRQYWLEAIDGLVRKNDDGSARKGSYTSLQKEFESLGYKITTLSIRNWVSGHTIGPLSIEAIKAVAILSDHSMLQKYPTQVDAAFKQIRTIHRVLGIRISNVLNRLMRTAGNANQHLRSEDTRRHRDVSIDPELKVPLDDLIDMLEFWKVIEVSDEICEVPSRYINVLLEKPVFGGCN